ncbi:MAG: hypothetical protein ACKO6A_05465 [Bacteroidota bacterium]
MAKQKKKQANSLDQNREAILNLLTSKSALKQDVAGDSEKVFESFKQIIISELEELKKKVNDERIRLSYEDRGKYEIIVFIGSDMLVFHLHTNVFRLPDSSPLWGTKYFASNENNGYFAVIHIYNFLAESYLRNRFDDIGNLIARVMMNYDNHFMVEGRGHLGAIFRDPEHAILNENYIRLVVQLSFAFALQFDLYLPPYEYLEEITVAQVLEISDSLKISTSKRMGFKP